LQDGTAPTRKRQTIAPAALRDERDKLRPSRREGTADRPGVRQEETHKPRRIASRLTQSRGPSEQLFLKIGKRDGVRPLDLVSAVAKEAGVAPESIGDV